MANLRQPNASTVEWYESWLAEKHPDWSAEQRREMATEFAAQQMMPQRPEAEEEEDTDMAAETAEQKKRRAERKLHEQLAKLIREDNAR
jgi:hypothetical protein